MKNQLREKLNRHEPILATRINSSWPMIAEIVGATGLYDYIEFLGEYAPYTQYDLENIARACELHDMTCIIKVDYANRSYVAQKAIASGFQGILFTDHTTADEVRETIRMVKPSTPEFRGDLGFVNRRFYKNEGFANQLDYAAQVNEIVIGFMIEKKLAVENIDEICAVEGVDFVQFGPADYSMNNGFNSKQQPDRVKQAEQRVIQSALSHGVSPRIELNLAAEADVYLAQGVNHFALGSELRIEKVYWTDEGKALVKRWGEGQ